MRLHGKAMRPGIRMAALTLVGLAAAAILLTAAWPRDAALAACSFAAAWAPSRAVTIDPASFSARVTNPWYPLVPGTGRIYRGLQGGKPAKVIFVVTGQTKVIQGVTCTVVKDSVRIGGKVRESTFDWFAQDKQGRVWYFGEDTKEFDARGNVVSTKGSWEAGVDGAQPGIFMPATPKVGATFRQEYLAGVAEDHFRIISLSAAQTVPFGSFRHVMKTREWTPLEPGVIDHKFYVRGLGLVREGDGAEAMRLTELVYVQE